MQTRYFGRRLVGTSISRLACGYPHAGTRILLADAMYKGTKLSQGEIDRLEAELETANPEVSVEQVGASPDVRASGWYLQQFTRNMIT